MDSSSESSAASNFPVLIIAIIGILATALLLLSYYIFVIKCCLYWHRVDLLRHVPDPSSDPPPANTQSAIPRGLDDSLIRLIPVIRFRKEAKKPGEKTGDETGDETEYLECSVCLSDFKEGEKLRVIPNCCHAFHIDCIDVWLQGNANCPVCRSCITSNTLSDIDRVSKQPNRNPADSGRFTGNDDDYVVIEIRHNNLNDPILVRGSDSGSGDLSPIEIALSPWKTGKQSYDDECVDLRVEEDEFDRVHPIRRSVSMDLSRQREVCSEIREVLEQSGKQSNEGKSFFSFGGRGGSRSAVKPLQLDS